MSSPLLLLHIPNLPFLRLCSPHSFCLRCVLRRQKSVHATLGTFTHDTHHTRPDFKLLKKRAHTRQRTCRLIRAPLTVATSRASERFRHVRYVCVRTAAVRQRAAHSPLLVRPPSRIGSSGSGTTSFRVSLCHLRLATSYT